MSLEEARRQLLELTKASPKDFDELTSISRKVINCWINAGFEYPSGYVDEFVSIDSQADTSRAINTLKEKKEFYEDFRNIFMSELRNLRNFLESEKSAKPTQ